MLERTRCSVQASLREYKVKPVMIKHVDSGVLKQRLRECAVPNMKGSIDGCVTRTTETLHECMKSAKQKTDKH